ncbi:kinesin light chain [Zopfia rhizophila CBS 207.26]|uniref:Kinesin light chain n=1 Tax=Zopfia rhizophila CBS 207.26 TaxID=1314779 RepID=A0A6A6E7Y6_9PEZI|nr:kinesin light chain [Zopfia rhizophila CBS 207.26]
MGISLLGSRWFTRGWTLQELLAPASVEFFSREGQRLGDKRSLERQIHEITGIAISALQGTPLSQFGVDERFKWAEGRQTTREEDWAYCLLGIFDIFMPLIYGEGRGNAVVRLGKEINEALRREDASNRREATPHAWIVPFERNPRFIGREPQLTKLEEILFAGDQTTKTAITGLGGVGKTQVALELVYQIRKKHKNCSIIWIPATNRESLKQAYLDAAKQLSISGCEEDKADVKRLVQDYLSNESVGEWLLVFDNANDIDMWIGKSKQGSGRLIEYLPKSKQGSIIFTTRDRKTAVKLAHQNIVEVREMDETAARQLLQKCLVDQNLINSQEDTTAVLAQLTYLPLAIVQAAAYINENGIALGDYLSLLAEQEGDVIDLLSEEFEDEGRYRNMKNPVATTWLISFEQIRQRDPLAANYLSFMACVDPKNVPQSLLPPGQSRKETDAIGTLDAYSFITKRSADQSFDLHQLVHLTTRNWLHTEGLLAQWAQKVIVRLEEVFPDNDYRNRSAWRAYSPHARYALESDLVDGDWKKRTDLMWRYGMCLYEDGRWSEAEAPISQVLEIEKRVLGVEHPDTLTSMANLASTYRNQGRWKEAEELDVQVMETSLRVLGAEHPDTLSSMTNLASTYRNQGRWKEAEELEVQVMETRKRVLGAEHPGMLTSMANLASTYRNQGRWKEAEELEVQVMETRKRVLGAEHPDTLSSMTNLASTFWNQGRWKEAEELEVQVMETSLRVLGAEHPHTLTSMANLASTYRNQGRWKEAEKLFVQVMETSLRVLGAEHPHTLTSMANLASTYRNQGRWKEAEKLFVQVMETSLRVLGAEHPDTLTSINNLAFTWKEQGRVAEAIELMKECIQSRTQVLGANHPNTLSSSRALITWKTERLQIID